MVRQSYNGLKCKSSYKQFEEWMDVPITFPPVSTNDVSDGPLIVEAEVEGYWIRRVFVDQGAVMQVMFEHFFDNLLPDIKAQLAPTQTKLVGFSGEQLIPIGKIKLKVVEQEEMIKEMEETRNQSMEEVEKLVCLLKDNMDVFTWQPSDIGRVPRRLVMHALNVNHSVPLVAQKQRVLGTEKSKVVTREVEEWVKAGNS
nr:reverse transcriptase domain-containing protein [Tanacetum cinerariifolium]